MKKILLGFILFLPLMASATTTFPSSGIDYDTSTITIDGPSGAICLGVNISAGHSFSLTQLGFTAAKHLIDNFGNWNVSGNRCFQSIENADGNEGEGVYVLDIEIKDNAGNTFTLPSSQVFNITSATPDVDTSSFAVECGVATANNEDNCDITLALVDKFGNNVLQDMLDVKIYTPDDEASDDANISTKFRSGLRVNGTTLLSSSFATAFHWYFANPPELSLTALAPSIKQVPINIGTGPYFLSTVVSRDIDFKLRDVKEINTDGSVSLSSIPDLTVDASLRFNVPLEILPGFTDSNITLFSNVKMNNVLKNVDDSTKITGLTSLESTFESISEHEFYDELLPPAVLPSLPAENLDTTFTFSLGEVTEGEEKLITKQIWPGPNSSTTAETISLITTASYVLEGQTIKYPAGAIGALIEEKLIDANLTAPYPTIVGWNVNGVGTKNIGMSVEGIVSGNTDQMYLVGGDDNQITAISSLHSMDIREEIIKNGYRLVRNATDIKTTALAFDWNDFSTQDVVVVDLSDQIGAPDTTLTLTADTLPTGKNTLIVLNGNVLIPGDLTYATAADSFGLILLRDEAGPEPLLGNIFVGSAVKELNGTLFADGAFFSGNSVSLANANTNAGGSRSNQLLLVGTLFAKNTIGGSRRTDTATNGLFTPWGIDIPGAIAQRYDLHNVRTYDPDVDTGCAEISAGVCDPNDAAFVLRVDGKITLDPPPGFLTKNTH